jgi:type VI secretion system secreted protein VgrG
MEIHLKSGMTLVIESGVALTLKVGGNFVNLNPAGVFISGTMVMINSGGSAGSGSGASPNPPNPPTAPEEGQAGQIAETPPPPRPPKPVQYSAKAVMMKEAAKNGTAFCDT